MFQRFNNLNLGYKINFGFAALVLVLLLVVLSIFVVGREATDTINLTVDVRVPTTLVAASAQSNLLKMQAAVRGYLAVGDLQNIDDYNQAKALFQTNLSQLKALSTDWRDRRDIDRIEQLIETFAAWLPLPDKLFALHDNPLENQPALQIEIVQVQPLNAALLASVDSLARWLDNRLLDAQEPTFLATKTVQLASEDLNGFRRSFEGMSTNLSAYAATGNLIFKTRYSAELVVNSQHFGQMIDLLPTEALIKEEGASDEIGNNEMQALFQEIDQNRAKILTLSADLFAAVEGDESRLDLYLFQNQMEPRTEQMLNELEALALSQQTLLQSELNDGKQSLTNLRYQTFFGGFMVLLLGIAMVYIFRRNVAKPIQRLSRTAERIGAGDLKARATVETDDEIGQLATTFNRMTSQLSETFQAVAQAKEIAETADRAKSKFLASMSHELRTPLNAILGYAQILQRNDKLDSTQQNGVRVIQRNGEHLLGLINDILDLSKIEARKLELIPRPMDLPLFLDGIVQNYRNRAQEHGHVAFTTNFAATLPTTIETDETRLRQILLNLLENAFKFTSQGAISLSVDWVDVQSANAAQEPTAEPTCARLRFAIADTGIGISAPQLGKVFRPFEQVGDAQTRAKGSGLGLAITQELAYAMDGDLSVTSNPGKGSVFAFEATFPASWTNGPYFEVSLTNGTSDQRIKTDEDDGKTTKVALNYQPIAQASMSFPPPETLVILLDMALKGELPTLQKRVADLQSGAPETSAFSNRIRQLIDAYEEDEVIALLQGAIDRALQDGQPNVAHPSENHPV